MTAKRSDSLIFFPTNEVVHLDNAICPYCGREFGDALPFNKEHVIARKFVPPGTLNNIVNLLLRCCHDCNHFKSQLEDDISVITMHPDSAGRYPADDARLRAAVKRKVKATSRRTGKPIAAGEPPLVIRGEMGGGMQMTFTMRSPPQVDEQRLYHLAHFHLRAFFFWLTYNRDTKRGKWWEGEFFHLLAVRKDDWGNPVLLWFERETKNWKRQLHIETADGYFKLSMKLRDSNSRVFAWAIEWNKNFRLAGMFGPRDNVAPYRNKVPKLKFESMPTSRNGVLRMRVDTPLAPEQDTLFDLPEWDEEDEAAA